MLLQSNCGLYCGATVKFIDIDLETFNISYEILEKELIKANKNNKLPKIVIPVHFAGLPSDQSKIYQLSKKYKFKIIEDASHSLGSKLQNERVGSCKWSNISIFSFHPIKTITTGEGGIATTNDKRIYQKLKLFRNHGITKNKKHFYYKNNNPWYYEQKVLGFNYRMNDIEAALGISQLKRLDAIVKKRNYLAKNYNTKLDRNFYILQKIPPNITSSYHLFVIGINHKKGSTIRKKNIFRIKKERYYHSVSLYSYFHSVLL